jgi:hypothetical protein
MPAAGAEKERSGAVLETLGRTLMILGGVFLIVGALMTFVRDIPFLGKLPGDIRIERETFRLYIPITTSILLSLILTLLLRLFRK